VRSSEGVGRHGERLVGLFGGLRSLRVLLETAIIVTSVDAIERVSSGVESRILELKVLEFCRRVIMEGHTLEDV